MKTTISVLILLFSGMVALLLFFKREPGELPPEPIPTAQPHFRRTGESKPAQGELATPGLPFPTTEAPVFHQKAELPPEEREIVTGIEQYFAVEDPAVRVRLAQSLQASKAFAPEKMRGWLHAAARYKPLAAGTSNVTLPTGNGENLTLTLRVPRGYTSAHSWPLLLAYHPTGGNGARMMAMVVQTLDKDADRFLIAAPTGYNPLNVDSRRSWKPEPRAMLRHLRSMAPIDHDRIYVTGYSQGGYAAWSFATFYTDELAASIPVSSTFDAAPEIPGLWEALLPNSAPVPVLNVWGTEDAVEALGLDLQTPRGTIAQLNEGVVTFTQKSGQNIRNYRLRNAGHVYQPPHDLLLEILSQRRTNAPSTIHYRFRYLNQARAYWLEGLRWEGDQWGTKPHSVEIAKGESQEQATGRLLDSLMGTLQGQRKGQELQVQQTHLAEYIVWIEDGMIDWTKPVRIVANGKPVLEQILHPDAALCLEQAARTRAFDRLRWAGIRITSDGKATVLTAPTGLPIFVDGKPN